MGKNNKAEDYCGKERPPRKVLCQLRKGHKGSHSAIIYWEDQEFKCSRCKTEIKLLIVADEGTEINYKDFQKIFESFDYRGWETFLVRKQEGNIFKWIIEMRKK